MLLDLWLTALKSKYGVSIQTDNRLLLRQHLYKARMEASKPELESIVMMLPEQSDELWLVHKHADSAGTNNEGDLESL
jgi:hypothetical protein